MDFAKSCQENVYPYSSLRLLSAERGRGCSGRIIGKKIEKNKKTLRQGCIRITAILTELERMGARSVSGVTEIEREREMNIIMSKI